MNADKVSELDDLSLVQIHKLERKIGSLSEEAQLKYLNNWPLSLPRTPDFDGSNQADVAIAQAFYDSDLRFYAFCQSYKEYLSGKLGAVRSKAIPRGVYISLFVALSAVLWACHDHWALGGLLILGLLYNLA